MVMKNNKGGSVGWLVVVVMAIAVAAIGMVREAEAVTCSPLELSPCIGAVTSSQPPTAQCCSKLREQRPCLCGYLRNPSLRQYVNSPSARRVAISCTVPFPRC